MWWAYRCRGFMAEKRTAKAKAKWIRTSQTLCYIFQITCAESTKSWNDASKKYVHILNMYVRLYACICCLIASWKKNNSFSGSLNRESNQRWRYTLQMSKRRNIKDAPTTPMSQRHFWQLIYEIYRIVCVLRHFFSPLLFENEPQSHLLYYAWFRCDQNVFIEKEQKKTWKFPLYSNS